MTNLELDVCLVLVTSSMTLPELAACLGVESSMGGHSRGEAHLLKSRGFWKSTVWQLCSMCDRTAAVENHLEEIAARFPAGLLNQAPLTSDVRRYFSIGVFSNAQTPTLVLSEAALATVAPYRAAVEMRYYTSSDDSEWEPTNVAITGAKVGCVSSRDSALARAFSTERGGARVGDVPLVVDDG